MPRKRQKPIELLSEGELESLLNAPSRRAPTGIRNRAIIACLAYAGLRVSEVLALMPRDVDLVKGELNVRRGKGGRQRTAALMPPAIAILERWLDKRRELGVNGHHPVMCTLQGGPLSPRYVQTMLARYAQRAGIEKRCHPHGLRHWHASQLLMRGGMLPDIQQQLGHTDLAITSQYLDSIAPAGRVGRLQALRWDI